MSGAKRIEQLAPELEKIVATSEPIHDLADGFGGPHGPAEGPLWWKEGGYLLFSDIHNNRRMKYAPGSGVTLHQEPTNRANGLTRDLQGRLIACEHDSRRVTRQELDGSITVIANSFQGRQLNRPNDVVVKSDGCIYFTDPWTSPSPAEQWDLTFSGVYRVTPDLGTMTLLIGDFVVPNGLAFSPDESVLYINDFTPRTHPRLRSDAQWNAGEAERPRLRRSARRRVRRSRRHEGGCGRECLLRRGRWVMDHGSERQEAGPYRARSFCHHQSWFRRR